MLFVTYRAQLCDQSSDVHQMEIGRIRSGVVADYVALVRAVGGEVGTQAELLQYPRWAEHVSGLAARCARLLWPLPETDHAGGPTAEVLVEAAWIDIGFGSQRSGPRLLLERIEYMRAGFAPRIRVARENRPSYEHPAPDNLASGTGAVVMLLGLAAWGVTDIAELPRPLNVPVQVADGGTPVVRFTDIPEPARTAFEQRLEGATVPSRGAAYAWDWTRFLEGV